ncbi:hypothetical protein [Paraburkholderia humisilvae]|nr:hypothetical protein [Paraburkholderia humisilvae]
MRLISMMSDFPGAIQTVALPFGVRGLHDWRLRMNGRDFPNLQRTFEDTRAPLFAPASIAPARTGMRRVGLGMAACTLGALGCLAWVMSHDGDLPDKAVVPMRAVALVRVPAPQRPVSAPTSVSSEMDRLLDVHTTIKPVTRAAAQLAATPSGRATAHSHARVHTRMPTHTAQQARHSPVRMATADMPGRPAHATADMPQHDQALPGWLSDGPSALEDYRTLTGATSDEHSPGVRHASAPPVDPTEWARHVTQRRITETPDAFVH